VAGLVRVTRRGAELQAEIGGRTLQLIPGAEGQLRLRYRLLGLLPMSLGELDRLSLQPRVVAGRNVLVARIGAQTMRVGERLPPAAPALGLARFTGTYQPQIAPGEYNDVTSAHVSLAHGRLLVQFQLRDEPLASIQWVLQPVSDHEVLLLGTLADRGESVRLEDDGPQPSFRASGYRWRRVQP